jgi:Ala-tRNA(Pro) deacylase
MAIALEHGVGRVTHLLEQAGVVHQVVPHAPTFRAMDEAAASHAEAHYTAKTVVLHDRGGLRIAVIPADRKLDLDKARRLLGATKHLRLATEDEIREAFPQFDCGALPPVGLPLPEVIDIQLLFLRGILCAGGDHRHSIRMDPRELVRLAEPRVGDVSAVEDPPAQGVAAPGRDRARGSFFA